VLLVVVPSGPLRRERETGFPWKAAEVVNVHVVDAGLSAAAEEEASER
jgi:hypothetical protein